MSIPSHAAIAYREMVFHGVDMTSTTYVTWESVVCPPAFRSIKGATVDDLRKKFDPALPGTSTMSAGDNSSLLAAPRKGRTASKVHDDMERAAFRERLGKCLVDYRANLEFMCELTDTLELAEFIESVKRECTLTNEGERVLLLLNPPPKLGQVPWELLPLDVEEARQFLKRHAQSEDLSGVDKPTVLMDIVDVVTMAPLLRRDSDPTIPHPTWTPGTGMYLVQPWKKNRHNGQVLQRQDFETWKERIDQLGNQAVTPPYGYDGYLAGRLWLSDALRANVNNANVPLTRLLYIGHIKGSGDASALLLNDLAEVFGLDEVDAGDFRWFSAMDLTKGTTTWREKKFERLNMEADQDGCRYPQGEILPGGLTVSMDEFGEETVPAVDGWDLWPMPPRVGLIACHSGSESASDEPFGLAAGCLEAGAELVFATRWTMYTDQAFLDYVTQDNPIHPFHELATKVDEFLQSDTPIEDMSQWKRDKLAAWREHPSDIASAPITWAGLTVYRAPERRVLEDTETSGA